MWRRCYASMATNKTPFEILSLPRDATPAAIKKRYYELAKQLHPDTATGDMGQFQQVVRAYELLSNPAGRAMYLQSGAGWGPSSSFVRNSQSSTYTNTHWSEPAAHQGSQSSHNKPRYMQNNTFATLLSGAFVFAAIAEFCYFQSSRSSLMDAVDRQHRRSSHDLAQARTEAKIFGNQHAIGRMIDYHMQPWRHENSKPTE